MTVRITKPEFNLREKISELDKPSGLKGSELMRSDTAQDARDLIGAGRKNMIINGDMTVAQRGTSFSPTGTEQPYTIDRFQHVATNGVSWDATVTQDSSAPDGFTKSYKVTPDATNTSSGGGNALVRQSIEGKNAQNLAYGTSSAKHVTISFYAKSGSQNNGHQYTFQFRHFATDATKRSINAPFIITSSFQRFTFTFDGDTAVDVINTIARGLELNWILASGPDDIDPQHTSWTTDNLFTAVKGQSNFNDNTSNEFYLTGVQLEVGQNATEFEHRSFGEELALCQRYCVAYGAGAGEARHLGCASAYNATNINLSLHLPVPMRTKPTPIKVTGDGNNVMQVYVGSTGHFSDPTISNASDHGTDHNSMRLYVQSAASGLTAGQALWCHTVPNAKLILNAEI